MLAVLIVIAVLLFFLVVTTTFIFCELHRFNRHVGAYDTEKGAGE